MGTTISRWFLAVSPNVKAEPGDTTVQVIKSNFKTSLGTKLRETVFKRD
jgi:hypothetical protein